MDCLQNTGVYLQLQIPPGGLSLVNSSIMTDTLLAAMFVAGRSCGPPDALSSSSLAAIRQKYINATCYYAGPIFRAVSVNNTVPDYDLPCYNGTFESDIVLVSMNQIPLLLSLLHPMSPDYCLHWSKCTTIKVVSFFRLMC